MTAPLVLIPAGSGEAVSLPGLAPLLGVAGLGPAYPAAAGLTAGPGGRFLLGAMGYLWLAACELATGRTLLIGPDTPAPSGWEGSLSEAAGGVLLPLLAPGTAAVAILWGGAALALPILVRGRVPVLDMVGALVWAAALISVHRLIAGPGSEPAGLLAASLLAACAAVLVARRIRSAPEGPPPGMGAGGARATL